MFCEEIFDELALIAACQAAGFSLVAIRELKAQLGSAEAPGPRWRELAEAKNAELDRAIARLREMRCVLALFEGCACPSLSGCAQEARRLDAAGSRTDAPAFGR